MVSVQTVVYSRLCFNLEFDTLFESARKVDADLWQRKYRCKYISVCLKNVLSFAFQQCQIEMNFGRMGSSVFMAERYLVFDRMYKQIVLIFLWLLLPAFPSCSLSSSQIMAKHGLTFVFCKSKAALRRDLFVHFIEE